MRLLNNTYSISVGLLDRLKEDFPNRLPTEQITPEQLRYLQGQQSIINYLDRLYEEIQEEN
jgi:lysozyme family protein